MRGGLKELIKKHEEEIKIKNKEYFEMCNFYEGMPLLPKYV